jgi:hypothetical protein
VSAFVSISVKKSSADNNGVEGVVTAERETKLLFDLFFLLLFDA